MFSLWTIKGLRVLKEVLYVDQLISQMDPQIVVRDLQCGGLDVASLIVAGLQNVSLDDTVLSCKSLVHFW